MYSHRPLQQCRWFVTNGGIFMIFSYDISCLLAVVRFLYEMSCLFALVPNTVVSK